MMIPYVTFLKHAQKVTKTASASRPILKGVYHAPDGSLAVTDSHRLYFAKNAHSNAEPQTIDPKTGAVIDGNYPEVSRLIPESSSAKYTVRLDVKQAIDAFKALLAVNKLDTDAMYPMTTVGITDDGTVAFVAENHVLSARYEPAAAADGEGEEMTFNTRYFADALALFKDVGATEVTMRYYGSLRPFTLTAGEDDELLALLLPIRKIQ